MGSNGGTSLKNQTICWDCKRAVGGCSWAESFIPVEGWKAAETKLKGNGYHNSSYRVIVCPLFVSDEKPKTGARKKRETAMLGMR